MKYICLGYLDEKQWETLSESERIGKDFETGLASLKSVAEK